MKVALLLMSMLPGRIQHSTCSIKMCLRWTIMHGILKIICKIDNLNMPVYIHNNFDVEIARCSIPFPVPLCVSTNTNVIVQQNVYTNETIVKVTGVVDSNNNGNWSCRHGYGRDQYEAYIEIVNPTMQGQNEIEENDELSCLKEISFYTVEGVFISVFTISICLIIMSKCKDKGQYFNNRIFSFFEVIDKCFETRKCDNPSVKNMKIVFFFCFAFLLLVAGALIGVFEKDTCKGSFVFIFLGIALCLTFIILFLRGKENWTRNNDAESVDVRSEEEGGLVDEIPLG